MSRKKKNKGETIEPTHIEEPQRSTKEYAAALAEAGAAEVVITFDPGQAIESAAETIRELSAAGSLSSHPMPGPAWAPTPPPFGLMKEDARWWSLNDYGAVLGAMRKTGAKRVLEFGPGSSTLALVEGGAETIDTCEDQADWAEVWAERLVKRFPEAGWPARIKLHRFAWPDGDRLSIPSVDGQRFDLTLIDGPRDTERRPEVVRYALARSKWVLVPCEQYQTKAWLRPIIEEIAVQGGRPVEFLETGPDAGGFALIGPAA